MVLIECLLAAILKMKPAKIEVLHCLEKHRFSLITSATTSNQSGFLFLMLLITSGNKMAP